MPDYKLTAKTVSGENVPDPRTNGAFFGGGLGSFAVLHPGDSFSKTIPLNLWALVKEPGRYEVAGTYIGETYTDPQSARPPTDPIRSDSITITVLPRSDKEMDEYISSLANQIASLTPITSYHGASEPTPDLDRLVMKLIWTCSPKIVPTLLKTMWQPGHSDFWEDQAFVYYVPHSEEVRRAIVEAAMERGLAGGTAFVLGQYGCTSAEMEPLIRRSLAPDSPQTWAAGAAAAQQFAADAFTPRLSAIATDPKANGRDQAIYALAANRTDESVKTLKSLLNDSDEKIRATTRQAIRTAYLYRGIWRGTPLRPEDFDESFRQPGPP